MRRPLVVILLVLLVAAPVGAIVATPRSDSARTSPPATSSWRSTANSHQSADVGTPHRSPPAPSSNAAADGAGTTTASTASPSDSSSPAPNETRTRLGLTTRPDAYSFSRPKPDLATIVSIDDTNLDIQYEHDVDRARLRTASSRTRVIRNATLRIAARMDDLRGRERRAIRQYARGETTERDFARTLSTVQVEAESLDSMLARLRILADDGDVQDTIDALRARLETFTGPNRQQLLRALRAQRSKRVSVAATDQGYVLSYVDRGNGTYVREAFRYDNRRPNGRARLDGPGEAIDRVRELYPETHTDDVSVTGARYFKNTQLTRVTISYPDGPTTVYLDAATRDPFYEVRRENLATVPTTRAVNHTEHGVTVLVDRSFQNGPVRVTVRDDETHSPVDAVVTLNGQRIGRTGSDGTFWTVEPLSTYKLTVRHGGATANVTVSP